MKRLITLVMTTLLVVMAVVNINVGQAAAYDEDYCQDLAIHVPYLLEEPHFQEVCGPYIDSSAVTIIDDIYLVDYCVDYAVYLPEVKEEPLFKQECGAALKSAETCKGLFTGAFSSADELNLAAGIYVGNFLDYCYQVRDVVDFLDEL